MTGLSREQLSGEVNGMVNNRVNGVVKGVVSVQSWVMSNMKFGVQSRVHTK